LKYYTRGREIKLTGRHQHSPLLDTRTLDLREEGKVNSRCREVGNRIVHKSEGIKVNSRCREVGNRIVHKSEGTNSCKPKQTNIRGLSSCQLQRYFEGNFLFMINISLLSGDTGAPFVLYKALFFCALCYYNLVTGTNKQSYSILNY
jgi:hypothetical protein